MDCDPDDREAAVSLAAALDVIVSACPFLALPQTAFCPQSCHHDNAIFHSFAQQSCTARHYGLLMNQVPCTPIV